MKLGKLIGQGRTADVYAWPPGHVLKLYHSWWPLENIEYEVHIARAVYGAGVASPEVGDIITHEGRRGLVYQRLDGSSMLDLLFSQPERLVEFASLFAQLHTAMHATSSQGLPSQRQRILRAISRAPEALLPAAAREFALSTLSSLPDGSSLCHGDFHPANVIMTAPNPTTIDWENACLGPPVADVSRTALLLETAHLHFPPSEVSTIRVLAARFRELYLGEYASLTPVDLDPLPRWRIIMAAARLAEGIPEEEAYLISLLSPDS